MVGNINRITLSKYVSFLYNKGLENIETALSTKKQQQYQYTGNHSLTGRETITVAASFSEKLYAAILGVACSSKFI